MSLKENLFNYAGFEMNRNQRITKRLCYTYKMSFSECTKYVSRNTISKYNSRLPHYRGMFIHHFWKHESRNQCFLAKHVLNYMFQKHIS